MPDDVSLPDDLERGWIADQAKAATQWLRSLRTEQQSAANPPWNAHDRTEWSYLPGPRAGLPLTEMTAAQQDLAMALVSVGCGPSDAPHANGAIELERVRRRLATGNDELDGDRYWFRVFGNPATDDVWAWHVNGHHLAVHMTVTGAGVATTPSFLGAEPARVPAGPRAGWRFLAVEEDLGRELLQALDADQRAVTLVSDEAPADILTRHDPVVDTDPDPERDQSRRPRPGPAAATPPAGPQVLRARPVGPRGAELEQAGRRGAGALEVRLGRF